MGAERGKRARVAPPVRIRLSGVRDRCGGHWVCLHRRWAVLWWLLVVRGWVSGARLPPWQDPLGCGEMGGCDECGWMRTSFQAYAAAMPERVTAMQRPAMSLGRGIRLKEEEEGKSRKGRAACACRVTYHKDRFLALSGVAATPFFIDN